MGDDSLPEKLQSELYYLANTLRQQSMSEEGWKVKKGKRVKATTLIVALRKLLG